MHGEQITFVEFGFELRYQLVTCYSQKRNCHNVNDKYKRKTYVKIEIE